MIEAMGHINYDLSMRDDYKGLISMKSNSGTNHDFVWKMYKVPLHDNKLLGWRNIGQDNKDLPVLLTASFNTN